jgi:hypothetical protein
MFACFVRLIIRIYLISYINLNTENLNIFIYYAVKFVKVACLFEKAIFSKLGRFSRQEI